MYVMFQLRPFTVHNVFPCFYGPNKVIIILLNQNKSSSRLGSVAQMGSVHYVPRTYVPQLAILFLYGTMLGLCLGLVLGFLLG